MANLIRLPSIEKLRLSKQGPSASNQGHAS